MMLKTALSALGFALISAGALGCAARGGATVVAGASAGTYVDDPGYASSGAEVIIEEPAPQRVVFRAPPPLVVVEPDVYVVEDASYPIYFVDGFYWHIGSGGHWYRSSRWDEPWVTVDLHIVPPRIVHRRHDAYVHFHASASAEVYRQPRERGERGLRVERRDDRKARVDRDRAVDRDRKIERRVERPTPAAGPLPKRAVRRDETPRRDEPVRSAPKVDRDADRTRVAPPRPEIDHDRARNRLEPPRRDVDDRRKPAVDDARRPDAQPSPPAVDKKKARKKVDDKGKPKDTGRGRPAKR